MEEETTRASIPSALEENPSRGSGYAPVNGIGINPSAARNQPDRPAKRRHVRQIPESLEGTQGDRKGEEANRRRGGEEDPRDGRTRDRRERRQAPRGDRGRILFCQAQGR